MLLMMSVGEKTQPSMQYRCHCRMHRAKVGLLLDMLLIECAVEMLGMTRLICDDNERHRHFVESNTSAAREAVPDLILRPHVTNADACFRQRLHYA